MMKDMKNELLKEDLHKLLDIMIDENLPIGVLENATNIDKRLKYEKYVLTLKKLEDGYIWRYE